MAYLQPTEYTSYGLPAATTADWITAASALINTYCRRPDLNVIEYKEQIRLTTGVYSSLLSYLPLTASGTAASPLVNVSARYAKPRRGEMLDDALMDVALAFSLPGQWTTIDASSIDYDAASGEINFPWNVLGIPYNEVKVTYTAGLATIGDDIKSSCAQIVRNAQAAPALNASRTRIDTMQMQYFSSSLLDDTVKAWLRPYVANRLG